MGKGDNIAENLNKSEEYKPTTCELKLLKVLLNPDFATSSMKDIIQEAGISHQKYYDCFKNPQFVGLLECTSLELIKKDIAPLVNVGIKEAKKGSYQHWKALMEMGGLYTEKRVLEHSGSVKLEDLIK